MSATPAAKTVNKSALARARRANNNEQQLPALRKLSMIMGLPPTAEQLELPKEDTVEEEPTPAASPRSPVGVLTKAFSTNVRKAGRAVTKITGRSGEAEVPELSSELFKRGWGGLAWLPTEFTLAPRGRGYEIAYDDVRIASHDVEAVTLVDDMLQFTLETAMNGTLALRAATRAEFVRWVAAIGVDKIRTP